MINNFACNNIINPALFESGFVFEWTVDNSYCLKEIDPAVTEIWNSVNKNGGLVVLKCIDI